MSEETCAFCLGDSSEVPPFGTLEDAQDFVYPCSTCSLVTHRKCLVDWFNSIPFSQIKREYRGAFPISGTPPGDNDPTAMPATDPDNDTDNEPNIISFRSRWISMMGQYSTESNDYRHVHSEPLSDAMSLHLSTACPQCKSKITFRIKKSAILSFNTLLRNAITDTVQYSGIFLGLSGAATGIMTMGYVGLARCGISIVDALVPSSLVPTIFSTKSNRLGTLQNPLTYPFSSRSSESLLRQYKLQHFPLLPIMLFRMRSSSILDCVFNTKSAVPWSDWVSELLVCNYFSSLGNHKLARQLFRNVKGLLSHGVHLTLQNRFGLKALLKGIDWSDPMVLIGATVPARWVYEVLYRLTINRVHLNLTTAIRPRDIANSLAPEQFAKLESLESKLVGLHNELTKKSRKYHKHAGPNVSSQLVFYITRTFGLLKDTSFHRYIRLKLLYWFYKTNACLQHDYSSILLNRSAVMTAFTTVVWPFVSSDVGKIVFEAVFSRSSIFAGQDKDKLLFLSNLIGMAIIVVLKDCVNLYMCFQKANQLSDLTVVNEERPTQSASSPAAEFPGAYVHT